jgi:hypothetical protein
MVNIWSFKTELLFRYLKSLFDIFRIKYIYRNRDALIKLTFKNKKVREYIYSPPVISSNFAICSSAESTAIW